MNIELSVNEILALNRAISKFLWNHGEPLDDYEVELTMDAYSKLSTLVGQQVIKEALE